MSLSLCIYLYPICPNIGAAYFVTNQLATSLCSHSLAWHFRPVYLCSTRRTEPKAPAQPHHTCKLDCMVRQISRLLDKSA